MNEEKRVLTASKLSRMVENNFPFNVFKSQKSESLPHSFFFDSIRSKVIARVTRKSLRTFSDNLRAYLALAGGCDHAEDKSGTLRIYLPLQNTLPMVACSEITWQPADFAPGGRKRSGLQAETPLHLPVVASVMSRSDANGHLIIIHNMK